MNKTFIARFFKLKKTEKAWIIYDWANSSYQLSIASTLFPAFYYAITQRFDHSISFLGYTISDTAFYSYTLSFAFFTVMLLVPQLAIWADKTGNRKRIMFFFTFLGAFSSAFLGILSSDFIFGMLAFYFATVGYAGSLPFYNSYLVELAENQKKDELSALGYSFGYLGSIILLVVNLLALLFYRFWGFENEIQALSFSFVTVGVWWFSFSLFTFKYLPDTILVSAINSKLTFKKGMSTLVENPKIGRYLLASFFAMAGVLTVMYMAANFGKRELNLDDTILIPTILIIQFCGIHGSLLTSKAVSRFHSFGVLKLILAGWIFVCLIAYFIETSIEFMALGVLVGYVMGGTQSLLRSTFARMIKADDGMESTYFSLYDFTERSAMIIGLFGFGIIEQLTQSMRSSIAMLAILFALSILMFQRLKKTELT